MTGVPSLFSHTRRRVREQRGTPPSRWKEYAIKVIDRRVIDAQSYAENVAVSTRARHADLRAHLPSCVQREIAIMRALEHPSIIRLVSVIDM
jgi:hypothetical protein